MKRLNRCAAIAMSVIAPAIMSVAPPAQAATADGFTLVGSGTISPGLNLTPQPQNLNFSGSGPADGTDGVPTIASCSVMARDIIGAIEIGEGDATIGCTISSHTIWIYATFVRVGTVIVLARAAGGVLELGSGICWLNTGLGLPITGYTFFCGAEYGHAP